MLSSWLIISLICEQFIYLISLLLTLNANSFKWYVDTFRVGIKNQIWPNCSPPSFYPTNIVTGNQNGYVTKISTRLLYYILITGYQRYSTPSYWFFDWQISELK